MAVFGAKWQVLRSKSMILFIVLLALTLVLGERSVKHESSRFSEAAEPESSFLLRAVHILWQSDQSGYQHVWPEMEFGWAIVLGTMVGFFGAAFGSVGGVGGGGIFVPMLTLIVGFDPKSATAVSKCMIMGAAGSTVYYNLKQRHPTLDLPIIDYDLVLLIQPMLILGVSIGVAFNVIFADWMLTILLIVLFLGTAAKAFFKGVETWKKETIMQQEADEKRLESNGSAIVEVDYRPLPSGPNISPQVDTEKLEVSILQNIYWKEFGLLFFVWFAFLTVQIAKNYTATCSTLYWVLNSLQIPVSVGVFLFEAVGLYKGERVISSKGDKATIWRVHQLAFCCVCGVVAGIIAGLLGIGGGFVMGPLFLELGVPPQVASASATFGMMFSSSMSVIEYYLLSRFPVPYAIYFIAVAFIAAFIGQLLVTKLIAIYGRASIIIFILAFTIFISAISLGGVGISNMIGKLQRKEYMGFDNLCAYDA